ncbi:hypothetical protein FRB94_002181 [Tulasnella sp. JGI-2019a]|nr:hypothetical protein FRB93_003948 [Tulasnella sp. JGI-2019a]KAG9004641.1 hypothetical protein FRB94_002181 [Tulasnella sp. JGI-2019a]
MSFSNNPLLEDAHGRSFYASNKAYTLPVDKEERKRLDRQHEMIRLKYRGLYLRPKDVRRVLAVRPGYTPTILDIGTGSGIWPIEMAREFPHAQVLGVDLVSPVFTMGLPPNCRFISHDVNDGLDQFGMTFDFVNIRCVDQGITSYHDLVSAIAKILRPGGIFHSLGGNCDTYDEQFGPVTTKNEDEPGFSWTAKLFHAFYGAVLRRSPAISDVPGMPSWLKEMNCWEDCGGDEVRLPYGPWEQDVHEKLVGDRMRNAMFAISTPMRGILELEGHPAETVDLWITKSFEELQSQKRHLYTEFHFAWAVKKRSPVASL